jgi:hypothetical protein
MGRYRSQDFAGGADCYIVVLYNFLFFGLSENQKTTQLADVKSWICFSSPGKRYAAIANGSFQHPVNHGFKLIAMPDPVHLTLLGFTGGLTAAYNFFNN